MTTTQKTLIAGIVAIACTAGVGTYVVQKVKARASSARIAVNASPRVSDGAAAQIKETPRILTPNETRLHHRIHDVSFTTSDGKLSRLSEYSGKPIVIAFTAPTCPVALRYRPRLTELADRFKGKVEFLVINSRADSNAAITDALSASSTTEVFFLDSARTVL
ncbi:MAG: redoxin family protein, partial [Opitutaceae bacterium]|nr:redoxin family protein [Verrucomicrobiales bacterium]